MVFILKKGASKQEMTAIEKRLAEVPARKKMEAKKYCGVIELAEDPLAIQKKLRNDWE